MSAKRKHETLDFYDLTGIENDDAYEAREFIELKSESSVGPSQSISKDKLAKSKDFKSSQPGPRDAILLDSESDDDDVRIIPNDKPAQVRYIGTFRTKVVGIQHYGGDVNNAEHTYLKRELDNRFDVNAIQVLNVNRQQVGHLPANVAAGVAPFMDNGLCRLESTVVGKRGVFSIPLGVDVFADPNISDRITSALARGGIELTQKRGVEDFVGPGGMPIEIGVSLNPRAQIVNTRQATALLDELTVNEKDLEKMTKANQPRRLSTQLLHYQLQGLYWMMERENPKVPRNGGTLQMWKETNGSYFHLATHFTSSEAPKLVRGGLLADDMGLGKTLQVLSLITADIRCAPAVHNNFASGPTLVLCPRGLMSNWRDQALQHVSQDDPLAVDIYHGTSRNDKQYLESQEMVISTYGTVAAEFKNLESGVRDTNKTLFTVKWKRIILDEAHKIRNHRTQATLAINALKGESKWCLTVCHMRFNLLTSRELQ